MTELTSAARMKRNTPSLGPCHREETLEARECDEDPPLREDADEATVCGLKEIDYESPGSVPEQWGSCDPLVPTNIAYLLLRRLDVDIRGKAKTVGKAATDKASGLQAASDVAAKYTGLRIYWLSKMLVMREDGGCIMIHPVHRDRDAVHIFGTPALGAALLHSLYEGTELETSTVFNMRQPSGTGLLPPRHQKTLYSLKGEHHLQKATTREAGLARDTRYLLDQICPGNRNLILDRLAQTHFDTVNEMEVVIIMIFLKAIDDPHYCETYVDIFHALHKACPQCGPQEEGARPVTFRLILAGTCRDKFEEMLHDVENGPGEKDRKRRQAMATMKLIGHLFVRQLLAAAVIQQVILDLLDGEPPELQVEYALELITAVGKQFEATEEAQLSVILDRLSNLKSMKGPDGKGILSGRVQLDIQDISDLRANGWKKSGFKKVLPSLVGALNNAAAKSPEGLLSRQLKAVAAWLTGRVETPPWSYADALGACFGDIVQHPSSKSPRLGTKASLPVRSSMTPQRPERGLTPDLERGLVLGPWAGKLAGTPLGQRQRLGTTYCSSDEFYVH